MGGLLGRLAGAGELGGRVEVFVTSLHFSYSFGCCVLLSGLRL